MRASKKEIAERIVRIKQGIAKGSCAECVEKCKRGARCRLFRPSTDFMERVRQEVCHD